MKKVVSILLILFMLIPAFAMADVSGLEGKIDAITAYIGEPITLQMMVFGATEVYEKINEKLMELYPEIAEKVKIEVVLGGSGDFDVAQKLRLSLAASETLPDIVRLNYTQLAEFAEAEILMDITDYIKPYEDNIIEGAKQLMQYDGTYYAFPREVKPKMWFYRVDIFEECGIDVNEIKTVDDYIAAGEKIQEKYPDAHMENYNVPSQQYDLMMYLSGNGGRFCDDEGNYIIASNEGVRLAFETIKKIHDSKVNSPVLDFSADWSTAFASGELVSQLMAGWFRQDLLNFGIEELRGKIGVTLWPEEIRAGSEAGGAIWVVPESSVNKEIAAEILGLLSLEDAPTKEIYTLATIIPPLKSAIDDPFYNVQHPYYAGEVAKTNFAGMENLKIYPYTPASSQEITIVKQYLDEYISGNMDLDTALQAAQDDLINQIGNPYGM